MEGGRCCTENKSDPNIAKSNCTHVTHRRTPCNLQPTNRPTNWTTRNMFPLALFVLLTSLLPSSPPCSLHPQDGVGGVGFAGDPCSSSLSPSAVCGTVSAFSVCIGRRTLSAWAGDAGGCNSLSLRVTRILRSSRPSIATGTNVQCPSSKGVERLGWNCSLSVQLQRNSSFEHLLTVCLGSCRSLIFILPVATCLL